MTSALLNVGCRALSWAALLGLILISACKPASTMTPEESQRINSMTQKMVTRCVGRYLIDLPDAFVLNSEHLTRLAGVDVRVRPMRGDDFESLLKATKARYEGERRHDVPGNPPDLRQIYSVEGGLMFDRGGYTRAERWLEAMSWREGFYINAQIKARDTLSFEEHRKKTVQENQTPEKLALLKDVHSRLRGRQDHDIPEGQGTCFVNGFLLGPASASEWLSLNYELKGVGDGNIHFELMNDIGPEKETLKDRLPAIKAELKENSGHVVNYAQRVINELEAEEYQSTELTSRKTEINYALLEVNRALGNVTAPLLRISISAGDGVPRPEGETLDEKFSRPPIMKPAFSEAETTALWQKITATLRPRPGAL